VVTIYPADISPAPAFAVGTIKLASAYSGNAMTVFNQTSLASQDIGFIGDDLDTASLDSFITNAIGVVTKLNDQIGTNDLLQADNTKAPTIKDDPIANARAIMFRGGSNSGALTGWLTSGISAWGVTAQIYTVFLVVQPSSSMFCNQAGAPGVDAGALFDFEGTGGTVAALYNDANVGVVGGWRITDGGAFSYLYSNASVQVNPIVLTIISDGTRVTIYQNEEVRASSSASALSRTATSLYVGWLISSVAGATSKCWDGGFGGMMVYGSALSAAQAAFIRNSLYQRYGINQLTSKPYNFGVFVIGDSIPSGYNPSIPVFLGTGVGLYGMADYLQDVLSEPARVSNVSIPGSTVTFNVGSPAYAANEGLAPLAIVPVLKLSKRANIVIIAGGGNDTGIGPGIFTGNTHSNNIIDGISSTATMLPGMYVFAFNIATLSTIVSVDSPNQITISSVATSSTFIGMQICSVSPNTVFAGIQSIVSAVTAVPGTTAIVSTVLPRDATYQVWVEALNTLIRAGGGYVLADSAAAPQLNANPGPCYSDAGHLSAFGHSTWANFLAPYVNALMV
jgi:GDSL-like Lipase/Acylhydrolase family